MPRNKVRYTLCNVYVTRSRFSLGPGRNQGIHCAGLSRVRGGQELTAVREDVEVGYWPDRSEEVGVLVRDDVYVGVVVICDAEVNWSVISCCGQEYR